MDWIVVAAGEMRTPAFWRRLLQQHQGPIICADNGLAHCLSCEVRPQLIVGDFDSLRGPRHGIAEMPFPAEKEESDSQLAVAEAFRGGAERVLLLGGTGSRLDHAFANFKLLHLHPQRLVMLDGDYEAVAVNAEYRFTGNINDCCSLFPYGSEAAVVSTQGLHYPLQRTTLRPDSHGLSNKLSHTQVTIDVHHGAVTLFKIWEPLSDRQLLKSP